MAITQSDITGYLDGLKGIPVAPKAKPVVSYRKKDVKFFNPKKGLNLPAQASTSEIRLVDALLRANQQEEAGEHFDDPVEQAIIEQEEEIDIPEMAEKMIGMLASANAKVERTPLTDARDALLTDNPWDILTAGKMIRWVEQPGGDLAILEALKDAVRLKHEVPQCNAEVIILVDRIIKAATADFELCKDHELIQDEDGTIHRVPKERKLKPADVYRRWMKPLRFLKASGWALFTLIDNILGEQTLPYSELDNPSYVDGFTGEVDVKENFVQMSEEEEFQPEKEDVTFDSLNEQLRSLKFDADTTDQLGERERIETEIVSVRHTIEDLERISSLDESFNRADDLENLGDDPWSGELVGEEAVEGVTFKMQDDFKQTSALEELRAEAWPLIKKCNDLIKELRHKADGFKSMGILDDEGSLEWNSDWVQRNFRKSDEAAAFLQWMRLKARPVAKLARQLLEAVRTTKAESVGDFLKLIEERYPQYLHSTVGFTTKVKIKGKVKPIADYTLPDIDEAITVIRSKLSTAPVQAIIDPLRQLTIGAAPQDLLLLFLGLDSDFGFTDEDMASIRVQDGTYSNLLEFYEDMGDAVLDSLGDGFYRRETTQAMLDAFVDGVKEQQLMGTLDLYLEKCSDTGNPAQTKAFVGAFLRCAIGANAVTVKGKDGVFHSTPNEAGWEAWRQSVSVEGNKAYHQAIKVGKSHEEAMVIFRAVRKSEKGEKVVNVLSTGLELASGRKVTWRIAVMKLKANELNLDPEWKVKAKKALTEKGIGLDFAELL
jgi:hypothetical protein